MTLTSYNFLHLNANYKTLNDNMSDSQSTIEQDMSQTNPMVNLTIGVGSAHNKVISLM